MNTIGSLSIKSVQDDITQIKGYIGKLTNAIENTAKEQETKAVETKKDEKDQYVSNDARANTDPILASLITGQNKMFEVILELVKNQKSNGGDNTAVAESKKAEVPPATEKPATAIEPTENDPNAQIIKQMADSAKILEQNIKKQAGNGNSFDQVA